MVISWLPPHFSSSVETKSKTNTLRKSLRKVSICGESPHGLEDWEKAQGE